MFFVMNTTPIATMWLTDVFLAVFGQQWRLWHEEISKSGLGYTAQVLGSSKKSLCSLLELSSKETFNTHDH